MQSTRLRSSAYHPQDVVAFFSRWDEDSESSHNSTGGGLAQQFSIGLVTPSPTPSPGMVPLLHLFTVKREQTSASASAVNGDDDGTSSLPPASASRPPPYLLIAPQDQSQWGLFTPEEDGRAAAAAAAASDVLSVEDVLMVSKRRVEVQQEVDDSRARIKEIDLYIEEGHQAQREDAAQVKREVDAAAQQLLMACSLIKAVPRAEWRLDALLAAASSQRNQTQSTNASLLPPEVQLLLEAIVCLVGNETLKAAAASTASSSSSPQLSSATAHWDLMRVDEKLLSCQDQLPSLLIHLSMKDVPASVLAADQAPRRCVAAWDAIADDVDEDDNSIISSASVWSALFGWVTSVMHSVSLAEKQSTVSATVGVKAREERLLREERRDHQDYVRAAQDELDEIDELLRGHSGEEEGPSTGVQPGSPPGMDLLIQDQAIFFTFPPAAGSTLVRQRRRIAEEPAAGGAGSSPIQLGGEPTSSSTSSSPPPPIAGSLSPQDITALFRALYRFVERRAEEALDANTSPASPPFSSFSLAGGSNKDTTSPLPPLAGIPAIPMLHLAGNVAVEAEAHSVRSRFERLQQTPRLVTPRVGTALKTSRGMRGAAGAGTGGGGVAIDYEAQNRQLMQQLERKDAELDLMAKEVESYTLDFQRVKRERDHLLEERRHASASTSLSHHPFTMMSSSSAAADLPAHNGGAGSGKHNSSSSAMDDSLRHIRLLEEERASSLSVIQELEERLLAAMRTIDELQDQAAVAASLTATSSTSASPTAAAGEGEFNRQTDGSSSADRKRFSLLQEELKRAQAAKAHVESKLNRSLLTERELSEQLSATKRELDAVWRRWEEAQAKLEEERGGSGEAAAASPASTGQQLSLSGGLSSHGALEGSATATTTSLEKMTVGELRLLIRQRQLSDEELQARIRRLEMELQATKGKLREEHRGYKTQRSLRRDLIDTLTNAVKDSMNQHQNRTSSWKAMVENTKSEVQYALKQINK